MLVKLSTCLLFSICVYIKMSGLSYEDTKSGGLGEVLFNALQKYNTTIIQFLDDTDETNTGNDILYRSVRVALKLREMGLDKCDIIASCTHNHKHSCIPFIASQFLGMKPVNFDPNLSHLDTVYLLKLIQPKILFCSEEALEFIETCLKEANVLAEIVIFGTSGKYTQFSEYIKPNSNEEIFSPVKIVNKEDTALILFSSGTTGFPKGICLSHKTLLRAADKGAINFNTKYNKNIVFLTYSTLYWISAIFTLVRCIANGDAYVVSKRFDPLNTWNIITKYKVNAMFLAPYNAAEFLRQRPQKYDVSSLETFLIGSCPVSKKLMTDLIYSFPNTKIINGYGLSETGGTIITFAANEEEYKMQIQKPQSCGKIKSGMKWKIVDIDSEKILGPNEKGELRIKGEYLMNGYYKMDSSSVFDIDGYFKTGDIAYYDEDECFYVIDRIKDMFKYRGWHIVPAILEEVLLSHPAVKEAAIVGMPHDGDGHRPTAFVKLLKDFEHITADVIKSFFDERVSEYQKLRGGLNIVDIIPKTATGKTKRSVLLDILINSPEKHI